MSPFASSRAVHDVENASRREQLRHGSSGLVLLVPRGRRDVARGFRVLEYAQQVAGAGLQGGIGDTGVRVEDAFDDGLERRVIEN